MSTQTLTMALSKGKLLEPSLQWLAARGYPIEIDRDNHRKLIMADPSECLQVLLVKASDVPIYVEYGIADLGIVGRDIILEHEADVFEPLALDFGHCRMVVAGKPEDHYEGYRLKSLVRVGTKYPNIARKHFLEKGFQAEIIALQGSVELSVTAGLADLIVDIVETGTTLKQNGLVVHEELFASSARLIVNKASHKLKFTSIEPFLS